MRLFRFTNLLLVIISLFASTISTGSANQLMDARISKSYGKLPLSFVENKGQMDKRARFVIRGPRASAFFRNDGVTFDLWEASKIKPLDKRNILQRTKLEKPSKLEKLKHAVLKLTFKGANSKCRVDGMNTLPGKVNYMIGKDKSKWHTDLPTYKGVIYKNVWRGIDIMYRGDRSQLKYDIRVNPGADIRKVQLRYDGAQRMWLDKKGVLHIKTAVTEFIEKVPGIYQEKSGKKIDVVGGYRLLNKNTVSFDVKNADPKLPLVIDPASDLVYSTFLKGTEGAGGRSIAVDSFGCVYLAGGTQSVDFPTTPGAYDISYNYRDQFIVKLNASGSELVYSTFIGGSNEDMIWGIAIDSVGCAYVTGDTTSLDFPTTPGAYDRSCNNVNTVSETYYDAFVAKLNPSGSDLLYSTYLGGKHGDVGFGIAVDSVGCAYVTGSTDSTDFPVDFNMITGRQNIDVFVAKFDSSGSTLIYCTLLGGNSVDYTNSIAIDSSGCAYVTGKTTSTDFPITQEAFDKTVNGYDIFVTKLNALGKAIIYSTYLGGRGSDEYASSIAVDSQGGAYVTGATDSPDFPTTPGAFNPTFSGNTHAYVTKFNTFGSALAYSSFLGIGSNGEDSGQYIVVDSNDCAYVTGYTSSPDFPTTPDALDSTYGGGLDDAFVTKINAAGSALLYSTFLGSSSYDVAYSIAIDSSKCVYVTGLVAFPELGFPTTPGAFDATYLDHYSAAFVSKFDLRLRKPDLLIKTSTEMSYTGIGVINADGTDQTKSQNASIDQAAVYSFSVLNAGDANDSYTMTGPSSGNGWLVKYYDLITNEDVTYQVTGSGWNSEILTPEESGGIYVVVKPDATVLHGSINTLLVTAMSDADNSETDTVKAVTTSIVSRKPDMLIKAGLDASYTGTDIINTNGTDQTKWQNASPGQKVTYTFKVKNAGDVNDSFKITGPGSVAGWTIRYYESNTGAEVTSLVTGGGWPSGTLVPGATKGIIANVKPDATLALGSTNTLLIKAESEADDSKIDVVKAVTSFTGTYKTDMLIKSGPESSYSGSGIYSTDGTNQTKSQNVCAGQKVTFGFRARNGGNAIDSFRITGPAGGSGWSVKYYDFTTSADVTSQVTGAGWVSSILAPGTMGGVFVNIKPDSTVPLGSSITLTVTGTSMSDNTKIDVVKAVTTCVATYQPDLMIKLGTESTYSGLDIINTDGVNQTKTQNAAINQKVTCSFRVKNAGFLSDSFKITGPGGGSGWTVKYIDLASGADVTSQVTGTGWLSGTMAPGTDRGVYAKITPDATVTSGSSKTLTITAASVGNSARIDVVKAVTTVP